ncbi:MAG: tandem-95 repeat protein, partial [Proteobacteria bacterium]|nr:tandem-95 repeat protein [Pseudomonadota bacterium]
MIKSVLILTLFLVVAASGWYINDYYQSPVISSQVFESREDNTLQIHLKDLNNLKKSFPIILEHPPQHGSLKIVKNKITYTPNLNFYGNDSIKIHGARGSFHGRSAKILIKVTPVNDPPTIHSRKFQLLEDQKTTLELKPIDPEGDPVSFNLVSLPENGVITLKQQQLVYQPDVDFFGSDSFQITAEDGLDPSEITTIQLEILPSNDPPQSSDQHIKVLSGEDIIIEPKSSDVDSFQIQHFLYDPPQHGNVTLTEGNFIYKSKINFSGRDSFKIVATDGESTSTPAVISIDVLQNEDTQSFQVALSHLIKSGGVAIGDAAKPEVLFQSGSYIPASVLKILTALVAIDTLGKDYQFSTKFYMDDSQNLIIEGFGDPMISTDTWYRIAKHLKSQKLF